MISSQSYSQRKVQISLYRIFRKTLVLILLGYAFGGKGFAYIGFPPFYIDALIVGMCLFYISYKKLWFFTKNTTFVVLVLFIGWGVIRTIPYLKKYQMDTLRDSVVYFYASLAIITSYLVEKYSFENYIVSWYAKWMKWFPLWALGGLTISLFWKEYLPHWPWGPAGGVSVVYLKPGDVSVHLVGTLAFSILISPYLKQKYFASFPFYLTWTSTLFLVILRSRAGFLVVFVSFLLLIPYIKFKRLIKLNILFLFAFLGLIVLLTFDTNNKEIGGGRVISFDQIVVNVQSIFTDTNSYVDNTKRWRLLWWQEIINYTINGPYFWKGKGFGINLASDDGFQVTRDGSLRSPHNFHLTVLARMGVPGFALWILLMTMLIIRLLRNAMIEGNKNSFQRNLRIWIFIYLIAALINATFDVYLEGPMGGVWFWTLCGLGMGILLKDSKKKLRNSDNLKKITRSKKEVVK